MVSRIYSWYDAAVHYFGDNFIVYLSIRLLYEKKKTKRLRFFFLLVPFFLRTKKTTPKPNKDDESVNISFWSYLPLQKNVGWTTTTIITQPRQQNNEPYISNLSLLAAKKKKALHSGRFAEKSVFYFRKLFTDVAVCSYKNQA